MRQPYSYRQDPAVPAFPDDKPLFLYDGNCVLCSRWVQTVLRRDRAGRIRMLAAQTPLGVALYQHYGLDAENHTTNLVIAEGRAYCKSQSSLYIVAALGFPWSLVKVFRVVPTPIMDWLYSIVARNRLRWFGRRDVCMVSLSGYEERFLDVEQPTGASSLKAGGITG